MMRKIYFLFSMLMAFTLSVYAQNRTVSGVVTGSDDNQPLIGVTVQVKGSTTATSTDVKGHYSIKVTNLQNVVIGVKYIGYNYQEVTLTPGELVANFKMVPTNSNLQEVVITGYGEQKKLTVTGAISTINLKQVEDIPALNLSTALRGTVPGVSISGGTNRPGQPSTLTIRNPVSLSKDGQGTTPLFVIDDIIRTQADFEALDINEIEAVSVLKDAEAAIYGVYGANGVFVVRTKRGRNSPPKFSFSSSVGMANATQFPKMLSGIQLATFSNDYNQLNASQQTPASWKDTINYGVGVPIQNYYDVNGYLHSFAAGTKVETISPTRLSTWYTPDELNYIANNSTDYFRQAFKSSYVEREALNVTGGSEKTSYFLGADYVNQNSNFAGINSYKYGLRANITSKVAKGLEVFGSISEDVSYVRSYWYKLKNTSENLDNDTKSLQNALPWQQYFVNGNPVLVGSSTTGGNDNINFFSIQNSDNFTGGTSYATNLLGKITYEIPGLKGLVATVTMNENINSANNKQFGTTQYYYKYAGTGDNNHIPGGAFVGIYPIDNANYVRLTPTFADNYQLDAGLNFNRSFGKHTITALALYEQRESNSEGVAAESDGVVNGGLPYQTFTTTTSSSNQSSQVSNFGFEAFISRINYSYDNRYLAQFVYREDGSSRFSAGHNWGGFPSASVGWVVSEEPFFKSKINWVDQLKLRASVGLTGTDNTKAYQFAESYNLSTGSSGGAVFNEGNRSVGVKPNIANPNDIVTWDHVFKTDYGIDMQLLKNRLTISGDYFFNKGYDLLTTLSSSVPATIGTAAPTENFAKVNSFGYEISAGWRGSVGKKFTYSISSFLTWSDNKNILIDVAAANVGGPLDLTGKSSDAGSYGYKSLGIIRTQDEANAIIAQRAALPGSNKQNVTIFGYPLQPGMINFQDVNGDGKIDASDLQYLNKKSSSHHSLGFNWSVGYAGLNLNVIMGASWGGVTPITGLLPANYTTSSTGTVSILDNRPVYWADHWTPSNTTARFPAPSFFQEWNVNTDFWLLSAATINISSATLSYTIPTAITNKIGISSARLYAVGTNLYSFLNPYPDGYRDQQTDVYSYPSLRSISLGLNIGF
jgi:TonB-linked SusC/RagA family outer membrane protein